MAGAFALACAAPRPFDGEDMAACGERRNRNAFTQVAQAALLRGASGLTSGMTPRNISWFKPDFQDAEMSEASGARAWLDEIDRRMKEVLAAGGFYQAIHAFNTDLLLGSAAPCFIPKDPTRP